MTQAATRRLPGRVVPLLAVAAVAIVGGVLLRDVLSFETLAAHRATLLAARDAHPVASVALFCGVYLAIVAFSLPGASIATLTGGFLFGLFPGALYNVASATLGATLIFSAARWGGGDRLARRLDASEGRLAGLKRGIDTNQWEMLFLLRLVPAVPFFVANVLPALVAVPLHRFVVTTALGIVPGTVVLTSVGAGLGDVFAAGERPDLGLFFEPHILLPILGLCALAALPMAVRLVRGRAV